jgi:hypothetical protein
LEPPAASRRHFGGLVRRNWLVEGFWDHTPLSFWEFAGSQRKIMKRTTCDFLSLLGFAALLMAGCGTSGQTNVASQPAADARKSQALASNGNAPNVESARNRLVGTWNGSIEVLPDGVETTRSALAEDAEKTARFESFVESFKSTRMTLELKEDATMQMTVSAVINGQEVTQPTGGTWEVSQADGDHVVVKFVRDIDQDTEAKQFTFESNDAFLTSGIGDGAFDEIAQMRFSRLR